MKMLRDYNPKVYQELKKKQNDRDFNERLYLYFTQMVDVCIVLDH